jgi:putative addiction module component (TIGR02574 family)
METLQWCMSRLPRNIAHLSTEEIDQLLQSEASEEPFTLTPELSAELDRRLARHRENPDDVIPWEQVKANVQNLLKNR